MDVRLYRSLVAVIILSSLMCIVLFTSITGHAPHLAPLTESMKAFVSLQRNHKPGAFSILYYNPPYYVTSRLAIPDVDLSACGTPVSCILTTNKKNTSTSDVIIVSEHNAMIGDLLNNSRPLGQIWVFSAHESPIHYNSKIWEKEWQHKFNITMNYDRRIADIYWPYGFIRKRDKPLVKNFNSVFYKKTKEVLIINSHCTTPSRREKYIKELSKYIGVETLGACGKAWKCGRRYVHNDCFKIMNNYKFYLAFENSMCRGYFTEKIFENFNYDTIMIVRGGEKGQALLEFPSDTFISTDDFGSIRELGLYLKNLSSSVTTYTRILERKNRFHFPGYRAVFQETMCELCEYLNKPQSPKTIANLSDTVLGSEPCRTPDDLVIE